MTLNNSLKLFGYDVYSQTMNDLVKDLDDHINRHQHKTILAMNTLKLYLGDKDSKLKNIFNSFDYIIPDGQSIVFASSILKKSQLFPISGMELMIRLIKEANQKNYSLYFLGSPQDLLDKVKEKIEKDYPGIQKHYYQHGYYKLEEEKEIITDIANKAPDILFVAFGSPRKEEFIINYKELLNTTIMMGVGGSYEVFAGDKKLDSFTKKIGLRWFLRMLQDPKRLAKRYAVCNSHFARLLIKEKLSVHKN